VAWVLAIATVCGGCVAVVRAVTSGPPTAASAALPVAIGSAATAAMPAGGGAGQGSRGLGGGGDGAAAGVPGAGQLTGGQPTGHQAGTGQAGAGQPATAGSAIPAGVKPTSWLPATAGQGEPGPLPAQALSADGAVPGALTRLRALAAARRATTALPHSPELLAELSGAGATAAPTPGTMGRAGALPSPAGVPTATSSVTAKPTATAISPASASPTKPAAARLSGLDVASFQHPVTKQYPKGTPLYWSSVAQAGYKFAAIKGTEGDYYVNPWAAGDLVSAKAAGLDVTAYHFAIPNASGGAAQARFAVEYSGYATGRQMLPLMLDIEYDPYVSSDHTNMCYGLTASKMTAWIGGFVAQVRQLTGQSPVIYTTANWWNTCTGRSTVFSADPMWVAAYGFTSPPLPAGWNTWMFWQHTSAGTVAGVATPKGTDIDYFSPLMVGLIDPGRQEVKTQAQVTIPAASLGAVAGETLRFTARGLPPGLSVAADGTIRGIVAPAAAQLVPTTYGARLAATNSAGETETVTFQWLVSPTCARSVKESVCRGG
jgi:GH25 family lysozyme M1 (1,4-beta-N-acetylmuramidase)